jgi:protein-tyrosine phosphatase
MRPPTWIEPGRLIAGRHPSAAGPERATESVHDLLASGVTLFVDLTEEGELEPYEELVPRSARYLRFPVRDFTVPDPSTLTSILEAIDVEIEAGGIPYVHCWAGCGRTGVVVGCWLVRHGTEQREALDRIARTRGPGCPQTVEQRLAILDWPSAT